MPGFKAPGGTRHMTDTPHTCGLAMMLEVKVQEDRFYLPKHDAEQLAGAMCRARSAGMV